MLCKCYIFFDKIYKLSIFFSRFVNKDRVKLLIFFQLIYALISIYQTPNVFFISKYLLHVLSKTKNKYIPNFYKNNIKK